MIDSDAEERLADEMVDEDEGGALYEHFRIVRLRVRGLCMSMSVPSRATIV